MKSRSKHIPFARELNMQSAHKGALSKANQAMASILIPSAAPANINELREPTDWEPTQRVSLPTPSLSNDLGTQPVSWPLSSCPPKTTPAHGGMMKKGRNLS